ncbi:hypothetical protein MKW98_031809 [Papaver atlanticum]|uniref:Uncharacterized protein n=1 Tax=Papaver atlanticum TaxID=357466 RepID=A0AAD4SF13_9MAGN|nr:hypothetical protein MKW98_031809 [Papaver atlanticum]
MTAGRTYVLIFFLWAVITIITPTLIHLSAAAKSANLLSHHTKVEESIKASGMIISNYLERKVLSRRAPIDRKPAPEMASATTLAPTPAPAPEPEPVEGASSV